ncbi:MAG: hypothetical protein V1875_04750 [Candidatus Altiarchaeota archaeon]
MKIWTIIEIAIGLIIFGLLLSLIQPYVPAQLLPIYDGLHAIYLALVSIIIIIIDTIIAIFQLLKDLLPR